MFLCSAHILAQDRGKDLEVWEEHFNDKEQCFDWVLVANGNPNDDVIREFVWEHAIDKCLLINEGDYYIEVELT